VFSNEFVQKLTVDLSPLAPKEVKKYRVVVVIVTGVAIEV